VKRSVVEIIRRAHLVFAAKELPDRVALLFHELEGQVDHFHDAIQHFMALGYRTVGPQEYASATARGKRLLVSLDDNYYSWYRELDTFAALGITCTFYLNTWPLRDVAYSTDIEKYFECIEYRGDEVSLSRSELREIHDAGHIVGCHTHSHNVLSRLPPERWPVEIDYCKALLEDIIGQEVADFSYPFGMRRHFSEPLRRYCRDRGFKTIATGISGRLNTHKVDPFAIHRTAWKFERSLPDNLDNLRINAGLYANLFGRSVVG